MFNIFEQTCFRNVITVYSNKYLSFNEGNTIHVRYLTIYSSYISKQFICQTIPICYFKIIGKNTKIEMKMITRKCHDHKAQPSRGTRRRGDVEQTITKRMPHIRTPKVRVTPD